MQAIDGTSILDQILIVRKKYISGIIISNVMRTETSTIY